MKYVVCNEKNATHIKVLNTENNMPYTHHGISLDKVYPILFSIDEFDIGEEMILGDDNIYKCSFSLYLDLEYLRMK